MKNIEKILGVGVVGLFALNKYRRMELDTRLRELDERLISVEKAKGAYS